MTEEEKNAIYELKKEIRLAKNIDNITTTIRNEYAEIIVELINKQQKEIENAKWYVHQMIARINEDIEDYIDDDKEGNKDIIGEFRETKKAWQDVEKLLNGENKDNLFNDWRKYGEYE